MPATVADLYRVIDIRFEKFLMNCDQYLRTAGANANERFEFLTWAKTQATGQLFGLQSIQSDGIPLDAPGPLPSGTHFNSSSNPLNSGWINDMGGRPVIERLQNGNFRLLVGSVPTAPLTIPPPPAEPHHEPEPGYAIITNNEHVLRRSVDRFWEAGGWSSVHGVAGQSAGRYLGRCARPIETVESVVSGVTSPDPEPGYTIITGLDHILRANIDRISLRGGPWQAVGSGHANMRYGNLRADDIASRPNNLPDGPVEWLVSGDVIRAGDHAGPQRAIPHSRCAWTAIRADDDRVGRNWSDPILSQSYVRPL